MPDIVVSQNDLGGLVEKSRVISGKVLLELALSFAGQLAASLHPSSELSLVEPVVHVSAVGECAMHLL